MINKGLLLVISGPAGSGKGTTVKCLLDAHDGYAYSVSATTRAPRVGEVDGKSYFFVTRDEFRRRIDEGLMLEYAEYVGNYYGTPKDAVEEAMAKGTTVILEIDVQGGLQIKKKCPDAVLVMITPPDYDTLERRLRGRGTNTEEDIKRRLEMSRRELSSLGEYDYVVVNEDNKSAEAAEKIHRIVESEKRRVSRDPDFAQRFFADKEEQ